MANRTKAIMVSGLALAAVVGTAAAIDRSAGPGLPDATGLAGLAPEGLLMRPLMSAERRRALAENRALNRISRYTRYVIAGIPRRRYVALTFDDGPSAYTYGVVRALRRVRAPATFFPVGTMMKRDPRAVRMLIGDRYAIGDHTFEHPFMSRKPARFQRREIARQALLLMRHGGRYPRLYRPPYGSYDATTFRLLRRLDMLMVLWSVDPEDYLRPGTRAIVGRVLGAVKPGAIVLLHDGGGPRGQTVAAIPRIVRGLRRRGYTLVTVPQLLRFDPPSRRQPRTPRLGGY